MVINEKELQRLPIFNSAPWLDKTLWGDGPWQSEPDEFSGLYKKHIYYGLRNNQGCWCGYVLISDNNPLLKDCFNDEGSYMDIAIDVHQGVTYCNRKRRKDLDQKKHIWVGFDCCHYDDHWPSTVARNKYLSDVAMNKYLSDKLPSEATRLRELFTDINEGRLNKPYRDMSFVIEQCKSMIDQFIKAKERNELERL